MHLCTHVHLPLGHPQSELEDYLSLGQVNVQIMFLKDGRLFNEERGNSFIIIHSISLLRAEEHLTVTLLLQTGRRIRQERKWFLCFLGVSQSQ